MPTRNIYLKIEQIPNYSPVNPDMMASPPRHYARDCMRNMGHEDGNIPLSEVNARFSRGYHSSAILLADGSVLMGGDQAGMWKSGETTPHERYYPSYYFKARPVITSAAATSAYGANFTINTPSATSITEVVLLRPGAVTHGFNMSQRFVGCTIVGRGATSLQVQAPPDGNVAPPGWYLLFIVDAGRVPSVAKWIRITP